MTPPSWWAPVPVRPSRFVAATPSAAQFNVEVALDRVGAFAFGGAAVDDVAYCDLQTHLEGNSPGRLGSGRAAFWRGGYVKGLGRTLLAANWNDAEDRYHGSGHLSASSAIREHLISRRLGARGLGDRIVPCTGLLARTLDDGERAAVAEGRSSARAEVAPADGHLATLTVKPGGFARLSNVVWALEHVRAEPGPVADLFLDVERFLGEAGDGEPAAIAAGLAASFERGLEAFARFEAAGLFWVYTQDNFTLDGRYLDLETPLYLGAPFLGAWRRADDPEGPPQRLAGFEVFSFVRQWRLFLARMGARLRALASPLVAEVPAVRGFVRAVAAAVRGAFRGHLLFDDEALEARAVARLAALLDAGPRARADIAALARRERLLMLNGRPRPLPDPGWIAAPFAPARIAPTAVWDFYAAPFVPAHDWREGRAFAEAVARLGALTDVGAFLAAASAGDPEAG
jgi:hypothetical protein